MSNALKSDGLANAWLRVSISDNLAELERIENERRDNLTRALAWAYTSRSEVSAAQVVVRVIEGLDESGFDVPKQYIEDVIKPCVESERSARSK
jgi:hypothetical protein